MWASTGSRVVVLWPVQERPRLAVQRRPADESGGLIAHDTRKDLLGGLNHEYRWAA